MRLSLTQKNVMDFCLPNGSSKTRLDLEREIIVVREKKNIIFNLIVNDYSNQIFYIPLKYWN